MFLPAHKLKRDYKVTWEVAYRIGNEDEGYEMVYEDYECVIKDCYTQHHAWETWFEEVLDCPYDDVSYVDIDAVELSHTDRVNQQVYELVLAELFDSEFGVYEVVYPQIQDDYEVTEDLQGLEKMLVEHQAQLKYDSKR